MFLTYMGMLFSLHQHQLEEKNNFGAVEYLIAKKQYSHQDL